MQIGIPEKLGFLFEPHRYKIAYGGRGGAKSWAFARALLVLGYQKPLRILCTREYQNSIADSVHKLLSDQVTELGLPYQVLQSSIKGKNGTEFAFAGLKHNINNIKSFEGFDIVWVEEGQTTSKQSWKVLIPTIRKDGSEIWVSMNPELEEDESYQRWVLNPPSNAKVVRVNYYDNPWFPDVLRKEMELLKATDYDEYLNIWEGHCRVTNEGAVYAKELRDAIALNRITKVLPLPGKPIETFWDLGKRDHTAVWFAQISNGEYRILDFYQNRGYNIPHYVQVLQERRYLLGTIWLPHDARQDRQNGPTIENIFRQAFPNNTVRIIDRMAKKANGIEAARNIFPNCWFDEEKTSEGIKCLRHFKYDVDPDTGNYSKEPLHDEYSDGADAFAQLALSLQEPKGKINLNLRRPQSPYWQQGNQSWMGR
jgi:phage terminase large subunit